MIEGNRLEMRAKKLDGTVIDQLIMVKTENAYQDEIMDLAITLDQANRLIELFEDYHADFYPLLPEIGEMVEVKINAEKWNEGSIVQISQSNNDTPVENIVALFETVKTL